LFAFCRPPSSISLPPAHVLYCCARRPEMDARRDPWGCPLPDNTHKIVTSGWSVREHRRIVEVVRSGCLASGRAVRRARSTREGGRAVLRERRRRAGRRSSDMTASAYSSGLTSAPTTMGTRGRGPTRNGLASSGLSRASTPFRRTTPTTRRGGASRPIAPTSKRTARGAARTATA